MQAEDYAGAQKLMTATKERLQKVLPAAPNTAAAQSTRRGSRPSDQKTIQCPSMTISAQPVR